jgi:hypothetical protein
MIVFEAAAAPIVRVGESEIGGRRIAGRLLPYGAEAGPRPFRFDPLAGRFVSRKTEAAVAVGPANPEAWREAVGKLPPGPVLVGPGSPAEEVRGAYLAAAEGALSAGRPVYLLDPEPAGLPSQAGGAVVLCSFAAGGPEAFPGLREASSRGLACAVLLPLIPAWTAETESLVTLLLEAAAGGARSACALIPASDGESRRAIVEARGELDSEGADRFFELIHHGDWAARMTERLAEARALCRKHGLAVLPPRAVGRREPPGNAAAAAHMEERAELGELDEHRTALLQAAVRWIDESGRDLSAVAREGNFRKIFPFGGEVAAEAEIALGAR